MSFNFTDTEIIERTLGGDTRVFSELVKRYQNLVFSITTRYTSNREDAEEIAQDTFIKAFKSLKDFRGESKFSTWLYTITTTSCLSFLRKKKLDVHSLDNEHVFAAADNQDSGFSANQVEAKSRQTMVNKAIAMLGPDDANILTLFYKGEQSLDEIAKVMGIEANAVKVRLHRARGRLKEKMQTHFKEEVKNITD
ncbi:MAG: sigma-70 family RNA polymerase sigma factor [Chitinophagaceae bacterium]|nr:MAG: sigma-70 family RNA polymerase sigma factor [Chitinophagaceae bacterium]